MMDRIVIFTDLDGTLLDHETYSLRRALPALDLVLRRGTAVVPVSSKTASEIAHLMRNLLLKGPFISENGGGITIPVGYFPRTPEGARVRDGALRISLGSDIAGVRMALSSMARELGSPLRGFGSMTAAEVASLTDLKGPEVAACMAREYDEPFLVEAGVSEDRLRELAEARGHTLHRGGRFYHLTRGCSKGTAVARLAELFRRNDPDVATVAIGDSGNDLPMLRAVDRAFVVQRPDGRFDPTIPESDAERVQGIGPHGWRMAVERLFAAGKAVAGD